MLVTSDLVQALPALQDNELAPAIGLIFKLASETSSACAEAVKTVRNRVKKRQDALQGSLEAIRLAVNHHQDVAQEMLVDIDADCKAAMDACMSIRKVELHDSISSSIDGQITDLQ